MEGWQNNNASKHYLENKILTSNTIELTIFQFDWLIQNLQYIVNCFNPDEMDSFESEQSLEKLDRAERIVENLYGSIAHLEDAPMKSIAERYVDIVDGFIDFKASHKMNIIKGAIITIKKLKEAYEGVLEKGE